jgi:hypothetical protein
VANEVFRFCAPGREVFAYDVFLGLPVDDLVGVYCCLNLIEIHF